ncbi:MAG: methyltransferase domain-containing protein [Anaerolineales bacterium]|nr:methyltransferase domain-containing protein [Anaerolineales bacterium]
MQIDWKQIEAQILEQFPDDDAVTDYRGKKIDFRHIKYYMSHAQRRVELLCDKVYRHVPPPAAVLEVGAAYGLALLPLQTAGYQVMGADLQQSLDTYAYALKAADIPLTTWDLHRETPFSEAQFDVIIASEVLEHLQMSLKAAVQRLTVALKPGGFLLVTTPNLYQLPHLLRIIRGENINEPFADEPVIKKDVVIDNRTHPREPTMKELRQAMKDNQLTLIESQYFTPTKYSFLKHLAMSYTLPLFRSHLLVIGCKK